MLAFRNILEQAVRTSDDIRLKKNLGDLRLNYDTFLFPLFKTSSFRTVIIYLSKITSHLTIFHIYSDLKLLNRGIIDF